MRSAGTTKSGPPTVVTLATKSMIAVFAGPSFHDGKGSTWAKVTTVPVRKNHAVARARKQDRRRIVDTLIGWLTTYHANQARRTQPREVELQSQKYNTWRPQESPHEKTSLRYVPRAPSSRGR